MKISPFLSINCGVYVVPCKRCDLVYIGQTGKSLVERIKQHKYCIRTGNQSNALFKHIEEYNHNIDWENSRIVKKSNRHMERLIIESCIIKRCHNMNLNDGVYKFDNFLTEYIID